MIQEVVKSSSQMIAKLKRSGENSDRSDNVLIDQYFQRGLAYEKLNKIDRAISDFTACINIDGYWRQFAKAWTWMLIYVLL